MSNEPTILLNIWTDKRHIASKSVDGKFFTYCGLVVSLDSESWCKEPDRAATCKTCVKSYTVGASYRQLSELKAENERLRAALQDLRGTLAGVDLVLAGDDASDDLAFADQSFDTLKDNARRAVRRARAALAPEVRP